MQKTKFPEISKRKGKRYFFNKMAMFFNHLAAIALLVSYMASQVSPENFWFIAFFGLAYPALIIVNIMFVIYWALQLKKRAFYSLLVILAGWPAINRFLQFSFEEMPNNSNETFKVLSYNVKNFDLYNWSNNLETRAKIFELIDDISPDIMCLQEFFSHDSSELNNLDSLIRFQKAKYVHVEYTTHVKRIHHWGIATFSRYPIVSKGKVDFGYENNNICIYTDVKMKDDTVRIYNMHLQSIAFDKEDYKYIEDLQKNVETEDIEHSKNIFKRLKLAFIKRAQQAERIKISIDASPHPVIVCGDFNDTPSSYTYNRIGSTLKDAFVESGNGFGKTYIGVFPSFRIDFILHSKSFNSYNFKTIREELSDHFPISCYLEMKGH